MLLTDTEIEGEIKIAVSIIMPAHNSERYIDEAIRSVIDQSFGNWELIIINDGSIDNTRSIAECYCHKDKRIKLINFDVAKGAWAARSEGMQLSKGKFIAFLDSDDVWMRKKLEQQIGLMESEQIDFSSTAYDTIDESGSELGKIFIPPAEADYKRVLLDCPVGNSTAVYNASKLGRKYGPNVERREDYAFLLYLLKRTSRVYGIREVLVKYRKRKGSYSSQKLGLISVHWNLYRKFEHLSRIKSLLHIIWWCFIKIIRMK